MSQILPSPEKIRDYLLSMDILEKNMPSNERHGYLNTHLDRFIKTIQFIPHLKGQVRVLELGAAPYFLTLMIKKYLGYEVIIANYFGDYGEPAFGEDEVTLSSFLFNETHSLKFKTFNIEKDTFPYSKEEFDIVLCCEIIEHLVMDPSHMLKEIHRVLRPNGLLVITSPNLVKLDNVFSLLQGKTILYPYSGYGVYGRHNREFTPNELIQLLEMHNFKIIRIEIDDVYPRSLIHRLLTTIRPLRWRRDTIFVLCQAFGPSVQCYPDFLYSNQYARRQITKNVIIMGDADVFQLGTGWHALENWPPRVRWSGKEAEAELKPVGYETAFCFRGYSGPRPVEGEVWINEYHAGTFRIEPGYPDAVLSLPQEIRTEIAKGSLNKIHVRFRIKNPFIGIRDIPGSKDKRELGVAIERMWLA